MKTRKLSILLSCWMLILTLSSEGLSFPLGCKDILPTLSISFPHGWYEYNHLVQENAVELTNRLVAEHPHLRSYALQRLLEFAFENAAGHGSTGAGSRVVRTVVQTEDGFIEVKLRNGRVKPLPAALNGVVFTPHSEPFKIPDEERNRSGGIRGKGTPEIIGQIRNLVTPDWPVTGEPSVQWREVDTNGRPEVEFVLRLPLSTRVLRERPRRQ